MRRTGLALALATAVLLPAGCGGSSAGPSVTVGAAHTYQLANFRPARPVRPGKRTLVSFTIHTPDGKPLTAYKTCCEPHTGVDLIIVRSDNSHVQYLDSDIGANGRITQPVVFPAPGRYRIVIDAYPKRTSPNAPFNFQLFTWVNVRGSYHPQAVPAYTASQVVDGYHFQIQGRPRLKAIQANFLNLKVTDPSGHKAVFTPWRGALAHAIFFRAGSLDYSHTHVCSPGSVYCFSALGTVRVSGKATAPGQLKVGVLLPLSGTWRMFLLSYMHGHVLTAPFTLKVR
jgi:hypothetical protein